MASTRTALKEAVGNVDESMGIRQVESRPQLSPVASPKDIGRRPLRTIGKLRLDQLIPDPNQPRAKIDEEEIDRLASSIESTGQLHPIRVRWDDEVAKWVIVTGERRYRAALAAELKEIECYFHDGELTQSEILEQQLVENLLREDLKPLEEANGYCSLMELNDWNGKQVADALRVSPSRVSRALALLDLPKEVKLRIDSGEISRSSAYELSKLDNQDVQRELGERVADKTLTQRKASRAVRIRKGKARSKPRGIHQSFVVQNDIRVTVTSRRKVNYHEVQLALQEVLDEVQHRIDNNVQLY